MGSGRFVFAHLADAHVGAWPRDPAIRSALRESLVSALQVAEDRGAEFLLVSGDLFHTPVPDPGEVAPVAAALRRFVDRGRRVYAIYGSHDYVAHRTSWLDVLAETGVFVKVAPEAVRSEGTRWSLPFRRDEPTGARIAGVSGRAHGLDREYFRAMDSEAFREEPGFRIFQFHAAVEEYLPESLREHIPGIRRDDLPFGCDYYAGGHIHVSYVGVGPGGGLLVNPGAVFGTSRTDLENVQAGRTHQGIVIVTVEDGHPEAEFVDTAPREVVRLVDVDVSGKTAAEARTELERRLADESEPGALLFPRVHGTLSDGSLANLALTEVTRRRSPGAGTVHWDVRDLSPAPTEESDPASDVRVEAEELRRLLSEPLSGRSWLEGAEGERRVRELLRELGTPKTEGESRQDYSNARLEGARRLLGVRLESATG